MSGEREQFAPSLCQERLRQSPSERFRLRPRPAEFPSDAMFAPRIEDGAAQSKAFTFDQSLRSDRHQAAASQATQESTLGQHRLTRRQVIQVIEQTECHCVIGAAFQAQRPLTDCWKHPLRIE